VSETTTFKLPWNPSIGWLDHCDVEGIRQNQGSQQNQAAVQEPVTQGYYTPCCLFCVCLLLVESNKRSMMDV